MKKVEIRAKCWIEIQGTKHFGPGPAELLKLIQEFGSISKAAASMGLSYKKAWAMVSRLNARGRSPYIVVHKGGQKGGGAELTETGKNVVKSFDRLNERVQAVVRKEKEILSWI